MEITSLKKKQKNGQLPFKEKVLPECLSASEQLCKELFLGYFVLERSWAHFKSEKSYMFNMLQYSSMRLTNAHTHVCVHIHTHTHKRSCSDSGSRSCFSIPELEGPVSSSSSSSSRGTSSAEGPNSTWSVTINPPRLSQTPHPNSLPPITQQSSGVSLDFTTSCQVFSLTAAASRSF